MTNTVRLAATFALLSSFSGSAWTSETTSSAASADRIFHNGAVYTVDSDRPWASAVVIRDGVVEHVGDSASAMKFAGEDTVVTDLNGQMLLPGFQDSHLHVVWGGNNMLGCDLVEVKAEVEGQDITVDQLRDKLKTCEATMGYDPEQWLKVSSWSRTVFENGIPPNGFLDELFPERPVVVTTTDGWSMWVNQVVLDKAGITKDTLNPTGGIISRDPGTGEPTGLLAATAMDLVTEVLPHYTREQNLESITRAVRFANEHGITSAIEPGLTREIAGLFSELDRAGELNMRVMIALSPLGWGTAAFDPSVRDYWADLPSLSSERVRVDSVKMFVDGVIENATAPLLEPYLDGHGKHAQPFYESENLDSFFQFFDSSGINIHVHAIGDLSIRQALDSFERMREVNGKLDNRHVMTHLQIIDPADTGRFAELDVTASFSLLWAYPEPYNRDLYPDMIGQERVDRSYPAATLLAKGARIAGSSDWAVSSLDPLLAIESGVTRQDPENDDETVLNADERLSLATMIEAYTRNVAWLMKDENRTGMIKEGFRADLVVLDQNLFELNPRDISEAKVVETLVDGKAVYTANP